MCKCPSLSLFRLREAGLGLQRGKLSCDCRYPSIQDMLVTLRGKLGCVAPSLTLHYALLLLFLKHLKFDFWLLLRFCVLTNLCPEAT
jgi:hypothetical protein